MHAVFITGGKQYRVKSGDSLKVERLVADEGADIEFDQVLFTSDGENTKIGTPYVEGSRVKATVVGHGRAKKIRIINFKRRKHHMKRKGHRQYYTKIKITDINAA